MVQKAVCFGAGLEHCPLPRNLSSHWTICEWSLCLAAAKLHQQFAELQNIVGKDKGKLTSFHWQIEGCHHINSTE